MQTVAGHDVCLTAENTRPRIPSHPSVEETELASFVVEKQIDVGVVACLAARRRPEQIQMFDAELFEIGFVLLQPADGFVAFSWLAL